MSVTPSAVILCGGEINHTNLPIGTNKSNAMIPVNGKPVIGWILDQLLDRGINDVTLVLRVENTKLRDFVEWAYRDRLSVQMAFVEGGGSILHSLMAGLNAHSDADTLHLILGDTLVRDDEVVVDEDYVFVGPYDVPENWCLVKSDEDTRIVTAYYDKQNQVPVGMQALVGYYHFTNIAALKRHTLDCMNAGRKELSAVLDAYGENHPIKARQVQDWSDFGHINHFLEAKRKLLQTRFFNSLRIDSTRGIIEKRSEKDDKLRDELNWYHQLPDSLKVLAPRLLEEGDMEDGTVRIVQEYYGYPNLAELYVYGDLDAEIWHSIIQALLNVAGMFKNVPGQVSPQQVQTMYVAKTQDRLVMLREQEGHWAELLDADVLQINGRTYTNVKGLWRQVEAEIDRMKQEIPGSVIHGDYCFSNILYDVTSQIIRVIDPRGSFGVPGIYGDHRYDLAKLRHSICGKYDFLIAGLFTVEKLSAGHYAYQVFSNEISDQLGEYFDTHLADYGVRVSEIRLIEALLFISMVPYHAGHPKRQQVMYLQGVKLLNESLTLNS